MYDINVKPVGMYLLNVCDNEFLDKFFSSGLSPFQAQVYLQRVPTKGSLVMSYIYLTMSDQPSPWYTTITEVEFVHAVSAGGSVKFLPAV